MFLFSFCLKIKNIIVLFLPVLNKVYICTCTSSGYPVIECGPLIYDNRAQEGNNLEFEYTKVPALGGNWWIYIWSVISQGFKRKPLECWRETNPILWLDIWQKS